MEEAWHVSVPVLTPIPKMLTLDDTVSCYYEILYWFHLEIAYFWALEWSQRHFHKQFEFNFDLEHSYFLCSVAYLIVLNVLLLWVQNILKMEDVVWWYAYCIWVSYDETLRKKDWFLHHVTQGLYWLGQQLKFIQQILGQTAHCLTKYFTAMVCGTSISQLWKPNDCRNNVGTFL
jgi:hypothetical protein